MPEKIGVLFLQAQAGLGADAAVHADIMRNLDRDKFAVHVACTDGDGQGVPASLAVLREIPDVRVRLTRFVPSLGQRDARAIIGAIRSAGALSTEFLALRRYIARERIRIIHSTERPRDVSYNLALAKSSPARSVVHVHVKWSEEYSRPAKWGVAQADAVFGISQYVTDTLIRMGKASDAIHTVLNGIETARWNPEIDGGEVRREFAIPSDAPVLVSVSRLFSWKGQRELIRAFAEVRAEMPNVRLLVVGADAEEVHAGSFTGELKALAKSLGVEQAVVFTGARADVPEILAASDLFTMPSFEEPFGLVFLEAMAMRKAVVALDNGGTPEVVEHGRSGLLSAPWNIPALAANILTLLKDRELRVRMGEYGRSQVLARFNAQRMARDVENAYDRILHQRLRRHG